VPPHQSHFDFKTFSDETWSSDDDDFSESYYNKKSELMCVRHERSGKILDTGETIVPGVGVVTLAQNVLSASRSGRIFLANERRAEDTKEWNMDRLHQFCQDKGLSWPQKVVPTTGNNTRKLLNALANYDSLRQHHHSPLFFEHTYRKPYCKRWWQKESFLESLPDTEEVDLLHHWPANTIQVNLWAYRGNVCTNRAGIQEKNNRR
jgi:hypothetical protein